MLDLIYKNEKLSLTRSVCDIILMADPEYDMLMWLLSNISVSVLKTLLKAGTKLNEHVGTIAVELGRDDMVMLFEEYGYITQNPWIDIWQ